jgi:hypothetical protein
LNDEHVHYPLSATAENATPFIVDVLFHEELDPESVGSSGAIDPADFGVTTRVCIDTSLSADGKTLHLHLYTAIVNGWTGYITFTQSSAGAVRTAAGKTVPSFYIPVTNNVV